jgi:hypothetical protein
MSKDPSEVAKTETPTPETPVQKPTPPVEKASEPVPSKRAPKIGDIVDFILSEGNQQGQERPAIVVKTWQAPSESVVNLQVFVDGANDFITAHPAFSGIWWRPSVEYDGTASKPNTWHWPD